MARTRSYTDGQLTAAIAAASSWRGALRQLDLAATSSAAMRSVRAQADRLGLDYSHFGGQRQWTEGQLRAAVSTANCWEDVVGRLGLQGASAVAMVKGHAVRLGVDSGHLNVQSAVGAAEAVGPITVSANLARAGSLLAAAWFTLRGHEVSWPLEPSRYDLIVSGGNGLRRVQVKTSTVRVAETWKVYLSHARRTRRTYDPDEIDDFLIINGSLEFYLIPVSAVGGLQAIHLSAYERYRQSPLPSSTG